MHRLLPISIITSFTFSLYFSIFLVARVLKDMSNWDHNKSQEPYPASSPNPFVAPPPANYPINNGNSPRLPPPPPPPLQTKSKGDGFWRGCCAGWCCYCCLDACF
ncbi:cysteine-rich and transmembrane domain-containing protein WIH1 [Manihot esculenta]|uniref:Cysteine-rich transmembrane domain-containing protein n=1 Tax=Manihot esculenta TaxID=3983 RepID=A0A2C9VWS0_MANES|nr:cysteine-rich and transmembrane domain-containing protein WIH1 [Manihot esculenta]OAY50190.1 hypothetical protein MANES_05G115500v8 [Manihot esculenta]